ncbi:MAG: peptidase T [Anaerolineaceae bacterium]
MTSAKERLLRYVKINTQSVRNQDQVPSSPNEFDLARMLEEELKAMGLQDVSLDDHCYVMATLPANIDTPAPVVGLIAHMDTSPDMSGENVNPRIIEHYDGGDILLNAEKDIHMSPEVFPELKKYVGQELITTDGNTLLGADDKAGAAAIMTAIEILVNHPEIKHGTVKVGFTPDEEVGRGADFFDVAKFGADFAYTVDGGELGEIEYETFNAASAEIEVRGQNVHPGSAKDKMVNSLLVGMEFNALLPVNERPEFTAGYDGFAHLFLMEGDIEHTRLTYIIRDHDRVKFEARKQKMLDSADFINTRYGAGTVKVTLKDQYYNMREKIEPVMYIMDIAREAIVEAGIKPVTMPVRGGTDGSRLSYMGLPCPNLFAGGFNFHGKYECIPTASLDKAVEVLVRIVQKAAFRK